MECDTTTIEVKNIIQIILKARKISRLYPHNNPIYINIMKEVSDRLDEFLDHTDNLKIQFTKNNISFNSESVYQSSERQDNLALMFFKDGLRELTFKKGLTNEELEDFIKIIAQDFEKDTVEDDIVTLLWGKNFENIQYMVEDEFLTEGEDLEEKALQELKQNSSYNSDSLKKFYEESSDSDEPVNDITVFSLSDGDFRSFFNELEKEAHNKTRKLFNILFEIFYISEGIKEYNEILNHFSRAIEYSVKQGALFLVIEVQSKIDQMLEGTDLNKDAKDCLTKIMLFTGGHSIITFIGKMLDSGGQIDENNFKNFFLHLKTNAITPLIKLLRELKSIQARRMVIDALVHIGGKDISALIKELNDPKWYVVRNIVHVLRKIGDKKVISNLLRLLKHEDIRVRKEVIRALGELGGESAISSLQVYLKDTDSQIRKTVLSSLKCISSHSAKKIIMDHISSNEFKDCGLDEKKESFEALTHWNDNDVYDFLVMTINKRSFLSPKNAETRACAAYCLGLLDNKNALAVLNKYKTDSNKLLREYSINAIRRLEYGR